MSSLKLATLILPIIITLAGCTSAQIDPAIYEQISKIQIKIKNGRPEQLYRLELQRLINRNGSLPQQYDLNTEISSSESEDSTTMTVKFTLYDQAKGKNILTKSLSSSASIGAVESRFGEAQARLHAQERLSLTLAQKTFGHLILFFSKQQQTDS